MFWLVCVDVMVMSYSYVVSFTSACGVGMSAVYMMKRVRDRTPPCGASRLKWRCDLGFFSECSVCLASFNVVCD